MKTPLLSAKKFTLILLVALPFLSFSQQPHLLWSDCNSTYRMTIDSKGNMYTYDGIIVKYSPSSVILWTVTCYCTTIVTDNKGNVYADSSNAYGSDITLRKLDSSGHRLWSVSNIPTGGPQYLTDTRALNCDSAGNVYWLRNEYAYSRLMKYSPSGTLLWQKIITKNAWQLKTDISGNSYVVSSDSSNSAYYFHIFRFDNAGATVYNDSIKINIYTNSVLSIDNNFNAYYVLDNHVAGIGNTTLLVGRVNTSSTVNHITPYFYHTDTLYPALHIFHSPSHLVVGGGGDWWLHQTTNGKIFSFNPDGSKLNWMDSTSGQWTWGMTMNKAGNIIVDNADTLIEYDAQNGSTIYKMPYAKPCYEDTVLMYYDSTHDYIYKWASSILKFGPSTTTNVNEVPTTENNSLTAYPNPFSSSCTIETGTEMQSGVLKIIDVTGREVKRMENISGRKFTLGRNDLPPGLYLLKLQDKNGYMEMKKIIIE